MQLSEDFYAIAFMGYVYLTPEQRNEIRFKEPEAESKKEEYFKDPITGSPRVVANGEVARNFINCLFIFMIQMFLTFTIFFEYIKDLKSADKGVFVDNFV